MSLLKMRVSLPTQAQMFCRALATKSVTQSHPPRARGFSPLQLSHLRYRFCGLGYLAISALASSALAVACDNWTNVTCGRVHWASGAFAKRAADPTVPLIDPNINGQIAALPFPLLSCLVRFLLTAPSPSASCTQNSAALLLAYVSPSPTTFLCPLRYPSEYPAC